MKEKIHEILDLCLEIQMRGKGKNGFPFVVFETANYGYDLWVYAMERGFCEGAKHDFDEIIHFDSPEEKYDYVMAYLKKLLQIAVDRWCEKCL